MQYARNYKDEKELPEEGIMYLTIVRPNILHCMINSTEVVIQGCDRSSYGTGTITKRCKSEHGPRAVHLDSTTNAKYAAVVFLADEILHKVCREMKLI